MSQTFCFSTTASLWPVAIPFLFCFLTRSDAVLHPSQLRAQRFANTWAPCRRSVLIWFLLGSQVAWLAWFLGFWCTWWVYGCQIWQIKIQDAQFNLNFRYTMEIFICSLQCLEHIYTKKFTAHLKFKLNWASCILSRNPTGVSPETEQGE